MALGKCVVITEGVATRQLHDDGQAVIVPPHDAKALAQAIERVRTDEALRTQVAAAGKRYAWALGDESRLADDIAAEVGGLLVGSQNVAGPSSERRSPPVDFDL